MKKIAIGVGIVVAVLIAILVIVPFVVPVSVYKDRVVALVKNATGRELTVGGEIGLSLFPSLSLKLGDVAFSDVPGTSEPMVRFASLHVSLKLMPLLSGTVEINGLEAIDPVIRLSRDKNGVPNWVFAGAEDKTAPAPSQPADTPATPAPEKKSFDFRQISVNGVSIVNGTVVLDDQQKQRQWKFEKINLSLSLAGPDAPLNAKGDFIWNNEKTDVVFNAERPFDLLDGKPSMLDASVTTAPISIIYKGTLALDALPAGKGTASLDIPSIQALASWLEVPLPAQAAPLRRISFAATLDADGTKAMLSGVTLGVNEAVAKGAMGINLSGERPNVVADFDLGKLDLRPYLAPAAKDAGKKDEAAKDKGKAPSPPKDAAAPAPTPTPAAKADPADGLAFLHQMDADITLSVAPLIIEGLQVDKAKLSAVLKDGKLVTNLSDLSLAQGNGQIQMTLDGTAATPNLTGTIAFSKLQLEPLLAVAGQKGISGVLNTSLNIASQGKTPDALMKGVSAKGTVTLEKGTAAPYGVKTMAANGKIDASMTRFVLNEMSASVNEINAKGSLGVDLGKGRPAVVGKLDFGKLDLTPFMAPQGKAAPSAGAGGGAPAPAAAQENWSSAPIDFSALKTVDADVTVSAQPLIVEGIQIDRLRIAALLKDGKLVADIPDLALYKGTGKGKLTVDASKAVPSLQKSITLSGVQVEPLLNATAGVNSLAGTLNLTADVSTQGRSQRDMVSALGGKGSMSLSNGAIKGVDLARIARNVTAVLGGAQGAAAGSGQTAFSQMSASFSINQGVLTNPDLKVESPVLLLEGNGSVNLPNKTLNYRLNPKKVPMFDNQKGLQALLFPVVVEGPWANPRIAPDLQAALSDPSQIIDKLKDVKDLKDIPIIKDRKARTDALRGLLKGN